MTKFILWNPMGPPSALGTPRYRGHLLNLWDEIKGGQAPCQHSFRWHQGSFSISPLASRKYTINFQQKIVCKVLRSAEISNVILSKIFNLISSSLEILISKLQKVREKFRELLPISAIFSSVACLPSSFLRRRSSISLRGDAKVDKEH